MAALVYLLLCWLFGRLLLELAVGSPAHWQRSLCFLHSSAHTQPALLPARLAIWSGALWMGLLPITWLVYVLAYLTNHLFVSSIFHPLLPANLIALSALLAVSALLLFKRNRFPLAWHRNRGALPRESSRLGFDRPGIPRLSRKTVFIVIGLILLLLFSIWLIVRSFVIKDGYLAAGYSVFSDFAPHTALVRSFSLGRNWPTNYPHFANDGISYHFMFFFLCGNLAFLGLPIDLAINMPSILGILTGMLLLGYLAIMLTGRLAAWGMVMLLGMARSSMAGFTYLAESIAPIGFDPQAWLVLLRSQRVFIGATPYDDWGLWTVNVYANQRHLFPAISVMLLVILLFLPLLKKTGQVVAADMQVLAERSDASPVQTPAEQAETFLGDPSRTTTLRGLQGLRRVARRALAAIRSAWLVRTAWFSRTIPGTSHAAPAFGILLLVMLPYWHGSTLIVCLLVLAVLFLFSHSKLFHIGAAAAAIGSAVAQAAFFSQGAGRVVQPRILIGFISGQTSLVGIIGYLLEMMGIALPLFLLVFLLPGRIRRITMLAFFVPLLFAFTISLTPDVTVNHKYVMLFILLGNIWLADLLLTVWQHRGRLRVTWLKRTMVVLLMIPLLITGLMEWRIYDNINQMAYQIRLETPTTRWIVENTAPDAVFVTAPYHYNSFFLTGRSSWLGHSYYAWSAGHDTGTRLLDEQWLLAGADGDPESVRDFAAQNQLTHLLIDDTLRTHDQFDINEAFFRRYFRLVAEFPTDQNTRIYDLIEPFEAEKQQ